MYIYQQVNITLNYFAYPVDVDTELKYGERVFPSVTFCHLNPWNISAAETGPLSDLIKAYRDGTNAASFGFTSNTYDKVKRAEKWAQFYYEDMVAADKLLAASYDYNDLFITCSYDTVNCNETQFQSFYDPFFGRCHTFNFDGSEKSSRAGPTYGLRAVLRTRPSEYLPWIHTVGAAVFIHGSDETPFVDAFGYYVPVGTASSIGVRYVTREKLPSPYSTCSDTGGSQKNYYQAGYEVEACIRSCLQDKIIAQC
uniref:Uncharacterized protein n=1 Tax=Panagrolaimus sp. JU765 TaxID=591449 RepID=A0AC34R9N0_9BILA